MDHPGCQPRERRDCICLSHHSVYPASGWVGLTMYSPNTNNWPILSAYDAPDICCSDHLTHTSLFNPGREVLLENRHRKMKCLSEVPRPGSGNIGILIPPNSRTITQRLHYMTCDLGVSLAPQGYQTLVWETGWCKRFLLQINSPPEKSSKNQTRMKHPGTREASREVRVKLTRSHGDSQKFREVSLTLGATVFLLRHLPTYDKYLSGAESSSWAAG